MTDRNEGLRLADAIETAVKQTDADDQVIFVARWFAEPAAALLRQLSAERDQLRAEVERLTDSVAAKAERIDRLGEMVEELSADALRFRSIDWHWEPERDMGPGGRWWASIWVKETPRKNTAVAALDAARTTHKETE